MFGQNIYGQLGLGDTNDRLTPTLIPKSSYDNKEIKEVKGDVRSSGILTKDGSLYVFGYNGFGQLGLGDNTNRLVPTLLPASYYGNKTIKQFELYYYCLSILTTNNSLYTAGKNDDGALGLGDTNHRSTPTLVDSSTYENKIIRELCSGDEKLTLITTDEKVYSCGINNSGQLGNGHNNMTTSLALNTVIDNL